MSRGKLIGFVLAVILIGIFSSCLKEINQVYNPGVAVGVVRQHGDSSRMMANTRFGWIYADDQSSFSEGKCLLLSFDYDPSLPENEKAEDKGYYTVTLRNKESVPQQVASRTLKDTNSLLSNELPVLAFNPNDSALYIYLEGYLFLPSVCLKSSKQTVSWDLCYDPSQKPEVVDMKSIYDVYLRASANSSMEEGGKAEPQAVINAFDISGFISDMRNNGTRESDMYIRINYVEGINPNDSAQFSWAVTEPLFID